MKNELSEATKAQIALVLSVTGATPEQKEELDEYLKLRKVPKNATVELTHDQIRAKAFQSWLEEIIGYEKQGRPITRRIQIRSGPAPEFALAWAELGFSAGYNSVVGIPNRVATPQLDARGTWPDKKR